ncbi:carbohydrate sulfotransferase 3-like [Diadema antillarum]|uniref:carbohydrate sulfotransferase 3-like n=1 Tax=Diadema antillarum TaxID=105358 RepID=UPI003A8C14AF
MPVNVPLRSNNDSYVTRLNMDGENLDYDQLQRQRKDSPINSSDVTMSPADTNGTTVTYEILNVTWNFELQSRDNRSANNSIPESPSTSEMSEEPPVVMIMSLWRFGSSILGQLFNQNKDMFYLFEPLYTTSILSQRYNDTDTQLKSYQRDMIRNFSKCAFGTDFVSIFDEWPGRTNNRAICQRGKECKMQTPSRASDICKRYGGRLATKLIRADLDLLRPLIMEDGINLKIIHLVRDPRGAAASRIKHRLKEPGFRVDSDLHSAAPDRLQTLGLFSSKPETFTTVQGMCQWLRENALVDPKHVPSWLKDRYHLVKYEDFADSPLAVTQDLYDFVGLPLREDVKDWVRRNTNSEMTDNGFFSIRKNSHSAAHRWVRDLKAMEIELIEAECNDVLRLLKYTSSSTPLFP